MLGQGVGKRHWRLAHGPTESCLVQAGPWKLAVGPPRSWM